MTVSVTSIARLLAAGCALVATFGLAAGIGAAQESGPAAAEQARPIELKQGDLAPVFAAKTDQGKLWKSDEHVGKKYLVVYFYPADMTGGCTAQACSYRDALAKAPREDVEIVGVSGDSVDNHKHFKQVYELNFTLLADPDGKVAKAFGVKAGEGGELTREIGGEEVLFARGVTANRWTFVIDLKGRIAYIDRRVDPRRDTENVLKVIDELASGRREVAAE
ncbi:MAG: peroxiredoxin [Planctomycetales bacterium]|nr:peroxiredoxin [Planctomycetales bacterium]